jgi:anti-sigma factor RsiW
MDCHEARETFEEHRRRELDPERARAVEAHLVVCPACRALWARDEALAGLIRALPRQPAPAALAREVRALGAARPGITGWLGRPWVAAALAALVVAAVVGPWGPWAPWLAPRQRPADVVEALIQSGVMEHRRILLDLEVHPAGVDDPDALFARVRSVAEVELPKILAGTGELRLLTAKPTLLASRKTAAAALRYPTSPVTTYFILPGKDLPMLEKGRVQIEQYRPHMREVNGFNVVYWKQKDMAYIMVSGLDREGCQKLYLKMRKAL